MAGTLFVVATPIGNLEDITLRALRVLREVDVIAAEDTRRTARLLAHFGIQTATVSFHEHNRRSRIPQLIRCLEHGQAVAVVSDAGTPAVSDPGLELIQACISNGLAIEPVPGVSAHLTAAVASGFPLNPWTILGFTPSRPNDRNRWLESLARVPHTVSFFETPHRIEGTLAQAALYLGIRPIVVARELTKVHQEFIRGPATSVVKKMSSLKGEFTIIVGPLQLTDEQTVVSSDSEIIDEFYRMTKSGVSSRREAIRRVAALHSRTTRDVYALIEKAKFLLNDK